MSVELATRITAIESRLQELKSIGTPGNFNEGAIPFGGPNSGKLTSDPTNLYWDKTSYRLGIGLSLPQASIHVLRSGGSKVLQRLELASASGDTLLDLYNNDNTIGGGSSFLTARSAAQTFFNVRGDGLTTINNEIDVTASGIHVKLLRAGLTTRHLGIDGTDNFTIARTGTLDDFMISAAGIFTMQNRVDIIVADAVTNTQTTLQQYRHRTSGTPAANFGIDRHFYLDSTTTADRTVATHRHLWAVATDASRTGRAIFYIYDTAAREYLRGEASGTAPMIGFLGAGAVVRQTIGAAAPAGGTGATAGAYDTAAHRDALITLVNNMRAALINLGLCQT